MTPIDELVRDTQKAAKASGLARYDLAAKSGLSHSALRGLYEKEWNPTAKTLRKLWRTLRKVNV